MSRLPPGYSGPLNPQFPTPDGESRISIYGYTPSLALSIIGIITFAIPFVAHTWYIKAKGNRTFQFLMALGCAMEVVGYAFRLRSNRNPFYVNSFIIQYFLIVVSPVTFAACVYIAFSSALRRCHATGLLPLRPRVLVATFVCVDVAATALQILGAAFIGVSESARSDGRIPFIETQKASDILLAGLAIQSAFFLGFLVILGLTVLRSRRLQRDQSQIVDKDPVHSAEAGGKEGTADHGYLPVRFIIVLAMSSILLWERTLYRLAETAEGVFGYAYSHEWTFGVFEYAPVVIAIWLWMIFPLHKLLQR